MNNENRFAVRRRAGRRGVDVVDVKTLRIAGTFSAQDASDAHVWAAALNAGTSEDAIRWLNRNGYNVADALDSAAAQ